MVGERYFAGATTNSIYWRERERVRERESFYFFKKQKGKRKWNKRK
jgi:hypothetical protein